MFRSHLIIFILLNICLQICLAQTGASLTINREDRTIRVVQTAPSSEGAKFVPSNPTCEEGFRIGTVFAPAPYQVETFVNNTKILSNIALLRNPEGEDNAEKLDLYSGDLDFDSERLCPGEVQADGEQVTIFEGRTTITGKEFHYDNATGLGSLQGPVDLQREAEGESPALEARSSNMTFNVDEDITILEGGVELSSDGRVSRAESVRFDEDNGLAILIGDPATSRKDNDVVEGQIIEYDLDNNDVVVKGNIKANFSFER